MDSNGQTMMTKVISAKENAITCTFSTLEALNSVRKCSSTVHKVYAVFETLAKLIIVQRSLGFFQETCMFLFGKVAT